MRGIQGRRFFQAAPASSHPPDLPQDPIALCESLKSEVQRLKWKNRGLKQAATTQKSLEEALHRKIEQQDTLNKEQLNWISSLEGQRAAQKREHEAQINALHKQMQERIDAALSSAASAAKVDSVLREATVRDLRNQVLAHRSDLGDAKRSARALETKLTQREELITSLQEQLNMSMEHAREHQDRLQKLNNITVGDLPALAVIMQGQDHVSFV
jgi:hypothetical protein